METELPELKQSYALNTPEYPDDPRKQAAYTRYVVNGEAASEIVEDSRLSLTQFYKWKTEDKWDEKRAELLIIKRKATAYEVGVLAAKEATPLFKRYGRIQDALLARIEDALRAVDPITEAPTDLSPNQILQLANAMNTCHGVGRHMLGVAGIDDKVARADDEDSSKPTKIAVQVNVLNALQEQLHDQGEY